MVRSLMRGVVERADQVTNKSLDHGASYGATANTPYLGPLAPLRGMRDIAHASGLSFPPKSVPIHPCCLNSDLL